MIARMSKYNFVLFAAQSEDFVEKLRGLGANVWRDTVPDVSVED